MIRRLLLLGCFAAAAWGRLAAGVATAAGYSEFASGDLSDLPEAPTPLVLSQGSNSLFGESTASDPDYLRITVPASLAVSSIIVTFHEDPNAVFFGLQAGSAWTASTGGGIDPEMLLGWVDFPTAPGEQHIGEDILDDIGFGAGAQGFTPPLPGGTYAILLQAPSSTVRYGLDFQVSGPGGTLPGDFNGDQRVDGGDLAWWKGQFGAAAPGGDFLTWQRHVGSAQASGAAGAVPEPTTTAIVAIIGAIGVRAARRRIPLCGPRPAVAFQRTTDRGPTRHAFTLVELLVVMTIIGALVALIIPGVSASREAARKRTCGNNLKQLGVALHLYSAVHRSFPPGYESAVKPNGDDAGPGWAWGVRLLPMVEQAALYEKVDFKAKVESAAAEAVRMQPMPLFVCPSDGAFEPIVDIRRHASFKPTCQMAAANYVGSAGTVRATCLLCRDNFDGVFGRNRPTRLEEVVDGMSNTVAIGERAKQWADAAMWGVVAGSRLFDNQRPDRYAGGPAYVLGTTFRDGFNICDTQDDDPNAADTYAESFGSMHPGGSHFTFCDGGVRFVFDTVDPGVMNALATRDTMAKEGKVDPVIHQSPF